MDKKYLNHDFYEIIEKNGEKWIEINAYYYESDKASSLVEYSDFEMPLRKFIENFVSKGSECSEAIGQYIDNTPSIKQYQCDISIDIEPHYYDAPATELSYQNLALDTPIGIYINYED